MRLDYHEHADVMRAMGGLETAVKRGPLERSLLELVKIRASQLNGCAHCLEMHTKDARAEGESDDRLHLVAAWREAEGMFTAREQAALQWCEDVTLLADRGIDDQAFAAASTEFDEDDLCSLTLAIVAINGWNRLAVAFRAPVGEYVAGTHS